MSQYKRVNSFFFGTELASSGLPEGKELEILNELKDQGAAERLYDAVSKIPPAAIRGKQRENLRKAVVLLKDARLCAEGQSHGQGPHRPAAVLRDPAVEPDARARRPSLRQQSQAHRYRRPGPDRRSIAIYQSHAPSTTT